MSAVTRFSWNHPARLIGKPGGGRLGRAAILGVLTGILGIIILLTFGYKLEDDIGLALLFHLRGERHPPSDVVVVSLDRPSSDQLGLNYNHSEWPRSYHARLVQSLAAAGASVIAFDVFFGERRSAEDDDVFAAAIGKAGNVVLTEDLRQQIIPVTQGTGGRARDLITVEQLVPPVPMLAQQAASIAPFPLPKVPVRVSQYWTFKQTGAVPTFPAVVFEIFALKSHAYDDLAALISKALGDPRVIQAEGSADKLARSEAVRLISTDRNAIRGTDAIDALARSMKKIFGNDTVIARIIRNDLEVDGSHTLPAGRRKILTALVNMYKNPNSRYLNFYGPPRTVTTIPYDKALQASLRGGFDGHAIDFKGKVVFVGYSDIAPQNQGDFYNTVYSLPDGRDLSGVEIAATAFANLMENTPVRPLHFSTHALIILLCGITMGLLCYLLRPLVAVVYVVVLSMLYLDYSALQFSTAGIWFPIVIPVAFQAPFAFTAAILWKYYDSRKTEVAHERLREVDRLKSMFISQVSHELRAPLSSIQGFVENMLDGMTGELKGKQREYLQRVRENTERLTRMITNLLDLSRIEAGTQRVDRVPWRLFDLVEEVIRQFDPLATRKGLALDLVCPDTTLQILADHDKVVQIITNLVDNAIKFTPTGGRVAVSLARFESDQIIMKVSDTGQGIPPEALKNLFKPFYQAMHGSGSPMKGLGLGLSIVKSLVEIHGGTISVTSEPGQGSEFRVLFPLYVEAKLSGTARAANS